MEEEENNHWKVTGDVTMDPSALVKKLLGPEEKCLIISLKSGCLGCCYTIWMECGISRLCSCNMHLNISVMVNVIEYF